jgi:hypothetical protein
VNNNPLNLADPSGKSWLAGLAIALQLAAASLPTPVVPALQPYVKAATEISKVVVKTLEDSEIVSGLSEVAGNAAKGGLELLAESGAAAGEVAALSFGEVVVAAGTALGVGYYVGTVLNDYVLSPLIFDPLMDLYFDGPPLNSYRIDYTDPFAGVTVQCFP